MHFTENLVYGQYIATAHDPSSENSSNDFNNMAAGTVNWAMQVSFDPQLIGMSIKKGRDLEKMISSSKAFVLHIAGEEQNRLIKDFGKPSTFTESTVNGVAYEKDDNGHIILPETICYATCSVVGETTLGDHTLFIAEVEKEKQLRDDKPLSTLSAEVQYTD